MRAKIGNQTGAQGVEADVAHQLQQIRIGIADGRLVAILEEMPEALVAAVNVECITGEQSAHEVGQTCLSRTQQQVEMIGHERPGETLGLRSGQQRRQAVEKVPAVVVSEDLAAPPAHDDVLKEVRQVEAGGPGHRRVLSANSQPNQQVNNVPTKQPCRTAKQGVHSTKSTEKDVEMNTLAANELKRHGMTAIEERLRHGPLHIIKRNRPVCVVLSEDDYQRLQQAAQSSGTTVMEWFAGYEPGTANREELDRRLDLERESWDEK